MLNFLGFPVKELYPSSRVRPRAEIERPGGNLCYHTFLFAKSIGLLGIIFYF